MDTPSLQIHLQVIRRINLELPSKPSIRINCIIQLGQFNIEITNNMGQVYTVLLQCDTYCCDVKTILDYYIGILKVIKLRTDLRIDLYMIYRNIYSSILEQGLSLLGKIGKIKWNKKRSIGFQVYYEVSINSILTVMLYIFTSDNNIIKKLSLFSLKCGVLIKDLINANIKKCEWYSDYVIKIYKPSKKTLIELDILKNTNGLDERQELL